MPEYGTIGVKLNEVFENGRLNLYSEVIGKKYFSFYLKEDHLVFQAGGFVGIIPINDHITLDIKPRVPVNNMQRILEVTSEVPRMLDFHLRGYATLDAPSPSLLDILANALTRGLQEIERYGLHKEYIRRSQDTSFPRGRIMMSETMQRHAGRGRDYMVTASWFEHSADTAPNRCLRYAIRVLVQRYRSITLHKGQGRVIGALNIADYMFDKVTIDNSLSFLKDPLIRDPNGLPAIRSYYAPLIRLAVSIIENRGVSFDQEGQSLSLPSMIFDFDVLFENYARKVLQNRLEQMVPHLRVLDGNFMPPAGGAKLLFDTSPKSEKANPDVVVRREGTVAEDQMFPLVLDVKYKPVKYPDRSDIEQGIGYGFSYRCPNVVLCHPKREGGAAGLFDVGTMQGYHFYQYIFDLAADDPEAEEARFAEAMLKLTAEKEADGYL